MKVAFVTIAAVGSTVRNITFPFYDVKDQWCKLFNFLCKIPKFWIESSSICQGPNFNLTSALCRHFDLWLSLIQTIVHHIQLRCCLNHVAESGNLTPGNVLGLLKCWIFKVIYNATTWYRLATSQGRDSRDRWGEIGPSGCGLDRTPGICDSLIEQCPVDLAFQCN